MKNQSLVAKYTPKVAIKKPIKSKLVNFSFRKNQAMKADVGGIKKNTETVLLAEFFFIKNISIVKAPKETRKIWWHIAIKNVLVKFIYGFEKDIIIIIWNMKPPTAW